MFSCTNPLTEIITSNSRALQYTIIVDPVPIGEVNSPLSVPLLAGKSMDVGTVDAWIDENMLNISFNSTWKLMETHLDMVTDPMNFPQTKKGNPKPGQFAYKTNHEPDTYTYIYSIPMDDFEEVEILYFAAHAVVEEWDGGVFVKKESAWAAGYDFPGANWATYFAGAVPEPGSEYEDGSVTVAFSDYPEGDGYQPYIGLFPTAATLLIWKIF